MNVIIVRYSEIGTKGKNRIIFERQLAKNLKKALKCKIIRSRGRMIIEDSEKKPDKVFGISSYSHAVETKANISCIAEAALKLTNEFNEKTTFRIRTQRVDKNFPLGSMEISAMIGKIIIEKTNAKAMMKNFDVCIYIEIIDGKAYVFKDKLPGPGGLPVGIQGQVVGDLSTMKGILACILTMKRGCRIIPSTDENIEFLDRYHNDHKPFKKIPSYIRHIVYGDTLNDMTVPPKNMMALRPLMGHDDIEQLMQRFLK